MTESQFVESVNADIRALMRNAANAAERMPVVYNLTECVCGADEEDGGLDCYVSYRDHSASIDCRACGRSVSAKDKVTAAQMWNAAMRGPQC